MNVDLQSLHKSVIFQHPVCLKILNFYENSHQIMPFNAINSPVMRIFGNVTVISAIYTGCTFVCNLCLNRRNVLFKSFVYLSVWLSNVSRLLYRISISGCIQWQQTNPSEININRTNAHEQYFFYFLFHQLLKEAIFFFNQNYFLIYYVSKRKIRQLI